MISSRRPVKRPPSLEPSGLEELITQMEQKDGYGPLLMTEAAAEAIGVARLTLRRWRLKGHLRPYAELVRGRQKIPLYGPNEIKLGQEMKGTIPPGPEPGTKRPGKAAPQDKTPPTNRRSTK